MSKAFAPAEHFRELIASQRPLLSDPRIDWLEAARDGGVRAFERLGFPERSLEQWRYSSPDRLLQTGFVAPSDKKELSAAENSRVESLRLSQDAYRLVFVDGRFVESLSNRNKLPQGVHLGGLRNATTANTAFVARWLGQVAKVDTHAYSALNTALIDDGLCLHIEAGIELDRPVEFLHLTRTRERAAVVQLRNLVLLDEGASATLTQRFAGPDASTYFQNVLTEVVLATDARLDHYVLQEESREAFHLNTLFVRQDAGSRYLGSTIALGASWSRTESHVRYTGEGADTELSGFYLVGDGQQTGFHIDLEHGVPRCASSERFKGIVYGRGRAVVDGRIRVAPNAQGSDAHFANANLLLSRNGEVDAKPQLEIFADDVKCSHGATIGQLDPDQIFYLRSRGLDVEEAGRLLCLAFADDIVGACPIEGLQEQVKTGLRERLKTFDFAGGGEISPKKRES